MKVYNVSDPEFKEFGKVLEGYDYTELLKRLAETEIPESGIFYTASDKGLEATAAADEMCKRGFGGYPVQLGYVNGKNGDMNCLEYHKGCEFNIAMDDVILILGREQDIEDGKYDSSLCRAFLLPKGVGIEMYSTTLHYAPFSTSENGYRVICVLPRGTNGKKGEIEIISTEDKMYFGNNKWLMAHPDAPEVADGAYVGITGKNIKMSDLEF